MTSYTDGWLYKTYRSKPLAILLTLALTLTMVVSFPVAASGASSTTWSQDGYDNVSDSWTPGNLVRYMEGDWVPYRANASGYVPTGDYIDFDQDYQENQSGALGYDGTRNWFIGPMVPSGGSGGVIGLVTKAEIEAYALATYGKPLIEPTTQFMGANAFTVNAAVELTAGGDPLPAGYTGDTILRYHVEPNAIGYTTGSATAPDGTFINALMTYYGGNWSMYYESHLAQTGTPNLFEGGIVSVGAGGYSGSNLHVTFDRVGEKTIPLPTGQLNSKDILVEKDWANIDDAVPVTINLIGQNGTTGTPYIAETITLDGIIDTNPNPEYAPWSGKFVDVPIYYYDGKVAYPIIYSVEEVPVPTGFATPDITGNANDGFTVYNEMQYGDLTISKTFVVPQGYTTDQEFAFTITGPSGPFNVNLSQTTPSATIPNLLPGEYTVSEAAVAGWSFTMNPADGKVTVVGGETGVATVTAENTLLLGSLKVTKAFDFGDYPGARFYPTSVDVTITGPSYPTGDTRTLTEPWSTTWDNLLVGSYTVHFSNEIPANGPWTLPADQTVTVEAAVEAAVTGTDMLNYETNTAWGYSFESPTLNNDFLKLNTGNQNWGWSFGPIEEGTFELTMLAGCGITGKGNNKASDWANGTDVGTATINYSGTTVTIELVMNEGNFLTAAHAWAGATYLPQKSLSKKTIDDNSPGSFNGIATIDPDGQTCTITIEGVAQNSDGTIYVAVHGVVLSLVPVTQ